MIDYEKYIFNRVYEKVAPLCAPKKFVSTIITEVPTAFPAASLIEVDNTTVRSRQTSTPTENYANITYRLDVYANSKREARAVFNAADEAMVAMNFNRMGSPYQDNDRNMKIFRYVVRYEAAIDRDGNIYRRA